jgi:hypothetical protein
MRVAAHGPAATATNEAMVLEETRLPPAVNSLGDFLDEKPGEVEVRGIHRMKHIPVCPERKGARHRTATTCFCHLSRRHEIRPLAGPLLTSIGHGPLYRTS